MAGIVTITGIMDGAIIITGTTSTIGARIIMDTTRGAYLVWRLPLFSAGGGERP